MSIRLIYLCVFLLLFTKNIFPHDPALTYSSVTIQSQTIEVKCIFPLDHLLEIATYETGELDTLLFINYFKKNLEISNDNQKCIPKLIEIKELYDINSYTFLFHFDCNKSIDTLLFIDNLFLDICDVHTSIVDFILADQTSQVEFSNGYNSVQIPVNNLLIQWGKKKFNYEMLQQKDTSKLSQRNEKKSVISESKLQLKYDRTVTTILNTPTIQKDSLSELREERKEVTIFERKSKFDRYINFFKLGVSHILTGYDHILFLIGLLLVAESIFDLFKIITSFTIAHSITLILASLQIFVLPSRLTESLIAISISYIAIENIYFQKKNLFQ